VGGGGVHDVEPDHPGLGPGDPCLRVDPDAAYSPGLHQHGVSQRPERPGVVAGALGGDPQATGCRVTDGGDHLGGSEAVILALELPTITRSYGQFGRRFRA
jgi:hypothetical protein